MQEYGAMSVAPPLPNTALLAISTFAPASAAAMAARAPAPSLPTTRTSYEILGNA